MITQQPVVPNWEKIKEIMGKVREYLDKGPENLKTFSKFIKSEPNKKVEKPG